MTTEEIKTKWPVFDPARRARAEGGVTWPN